MNPYVIARASIYWKFPGSTQRLAYVAVPAEVTKFAWQASDNTIWMLIEAPDTWVELKSGGSADYIEQIADGALGGHRVVKPTTSGKVGYADKATTAHAPVVLGITQGAAVDGDLIKVQYDGKMTESSWTWTVNVPIYCGASGVLTETVPTSGFVIQVGTSLSPTSILVNVRQPVVLV